MPVVPGCEAFFKKKFLVNVMGMVRVAKRMRTLWEGETK